MVYCKPFCDKKASSECDSSRHDKFPIVCRQGCRRARCAL